jgi:hypothetical protein
MNQDRIPPNAGGGAASPEDLAFLEAGGQYTGELKVAVKTQDGHWRSAPEALTEARLRLRDQVPLTIEQKGEYFSIRAVDGSTLSILLRPEDR